jgi:RNA polymerase sigma-70 factor (ECF subfamily)
MAPTDSTERASAVNRAGPVSRTDASSFHSIRRRLFGIAYHTLGNVAEADEVVQDTWIRWQCVDRTTVRDASAFLTTATARLALNVAQSARARHERPGIECLAEPVDPVAEPVLHTLRKEDLEQAVSVLLERLSPSERAAFVLREAFDYSYRDVAAVLGVSEENARQLASRARARLPRARRNRPTADEKRQLLERISGATHDGDLASLERMLSDARVRHGRSSASSTPLS